MSTTHKNKAPVQAEKTEEYVELWRGSVLGGALALFAPKSQQPPQVSKLYFIFDGQYGEGAEGTIDLPEENLGSSAELIHHIVDKFIQLYTLTLWEEKKHLEQEIPGWKPH